jgi:hypothetical protein
MVLVCVYTEFIILDSFKLIVLTFLGKKYYNMYFLFYIHFNLFSFIACVNFKCHTIVVVIHVLNFYIIFGTGRVL